MDIIYIIIVIIEQSSKLVADFNDGYTYQYFQQNAVDPLPCPNITVSISH